MELPILAINLLKLNISCRYAD